MPNRILREGILTSPRIAKLGWAEEVFYRRMHSVVDDFGRYFADVGMLRAACYPRQLNKVSDSDVGKWLHACVAAALVRVYQVEGEGYLLLLDFNQQVRAKKSRFPNPPSECVADAQQVPANARLDVSVSVSESVGVSGASAPPPPAVKKSKERATGLPEDFGISERVREWAADKGYGQLDEHLEAFKRKASAKGYSYVNWDDAFMEAIREDWAKLRAKRSDGTAPPPEQKRQERDPALVKLEEDALKAAKPAPEVKARMDAILKGKTYQ